MRDLDAVEYSIHEEYEAQINFAALDRLDPVTRSNIDMRLLARLTNTDPDMLIPYQNQEEGVSPKSCLKSRSNSVQSLYKEFSQRCKKNHDINTTSNRSGKNCKPGVSSKTLERANTIADFQSCISSVSVKEGEGSDGPVRFVIKCNSEQNVGEAKNLMRAVVGSFLVGSSAVSSSKMKNGSRKVKRSASMTEDISSTVCHGYADECVVKSEECLRMVKSGVSAEDDDVQLNVVDGEDMEEKEVVPICSTDADEEQL